MNELMTIQNVRGYIEKGMAYLNLEDVARGLGFTTVATSGNECVRWSRVEQYLTELGFNKDNGYLPDDTYIPENIFYRLAMKAKNETAEKFQAKVADEILPSIRKHGLYATDELINDPDLAIKAFTALKEERERNKALTTKIEQDKPLVLFAESCIASNDSLLVREVAKLASKKGITIGEKRLWEKLREWDVVSKSNEPYQKAFDAGWFEVKQGTYNTPYGSETYRTYKVSPKGQIYIIERLKKELNKSA